MLPHCVSRNLKSFRKLIHAQARLAAVQQLEQLLLPFTHCIKHLASFLSPACNNSYQELL